MEEQAPSSLPMSEGWILVVPHKLNIKHNTCEMQNFTGGLIVKVIGMIFLPDNNLKC